MNSHRLSVAVFSLTTFLSLTAVAQDATMKVTVNELIFQNAKNAAKKYGDAKLELTDAIFEFGSSAGAPVIEFRANQNNRVLTCLTKEKEPWAVFAPGQRVKVIGKWASAATTQLSDCEVVAVDKAGALIPVTAAQLGKEADDEKTMARYKGTSLLVTGKVLKSVVEKSGFTSVVLEGSGKFAIYTQAPVAAQERAKDLKVGETATIAGQFSFMDAEKGEVFLTRCWPVTRK